MPTPPATEQILRTENAVLRARLEEAEELLRAVRGGKVDALEAGGDAGPRPFIQRTHQGRELHVDSSITALRDAHGEPVGHLSDVRDITARKQGEEDKRQALLLLDTLLTHAPVGLAYFDRDLRYVRINERLAKLNGLPVAEHIGRNVADVTPAMAAGMREVTERIDATGQPVLDHEFAVETANAPEVIRHWNVSGYPVHGQRGEIVGYGAVVEEITARKQADAALHKSEERLRLAMAASDLGTWHWDLRTRALDWSERCLRIFGIPPRTAMSYASFLDALHPEDRARADDAVQRAIQDGSQYRIELRSVWPDGSVHWAVSVGRAYFDAPGVPTRMEGIAFDITDRKRAEQALAERTELLNGVLEGTTDVIFAKDLDSRLLLANAAFAAAAGSTPEQLVGKTDDDWFPPDVAATVRQQDEAVIARGSAMQFEETIPVAGEARSYLTLKAPLRDGSSRVVGILGIGRDITDRKRAEEALQLATERFELAVKCSRAVLWQQDLELRFTWLHNPAPGIDGSDAAGKRDEDLLERAEDAAVIVALKRGVIRSGVGVRQEFFPQIQGVRHCFEVLMEPTRDAAGLITGITGAAIDITQLKRSEEALHELERNYRALAVASSEIAYRMSPDWSTMLPLDGRQLVATSEEPLADWSWLDQNLPRDEHLRVRQAISEAIASKTLFDLEHRVRRPDGSIGWTRSRAVPIFDENEAVIAWFGAASDITDRKQADEEGRLLASIVESSGDFIGISDTHGNPLFGNRAAMELVGLQDLEQVRRSKIIDYFIPEQRAFVAEVVLPEVIEKGRWRGELTMQHFVTGAKIPVLYDLFRVDDPATGQPTNFATVTRDLTASKRAEETLRASEEILRVALRNTGILVYTTDADLRYTWIHNPHPAFRPEDTLGRRDEDLVSAEQAAPLTAIKRRVLNTGVGETGEVALEIGGRRHVYNLVVEALRDVNGGVVGVTAAAMDITATKQVEEQLRRLTAELSETDRRKDAFLATLAHELRNPLAPIRTGLEVMRLAGSSGKVEQARSMMARQLSQLVRLVDDLLDVSRITQGKLDLRKERVELRAVIDAAVETSRPVIEQAGHELAVVVADAPIFVDGDEIRLAQVVSNLLNNSAKYTHRGGHVRLTAGRDGGTAVVSVKDDGIGIPRAMMDNVFVMFTQVDRTLEKTTGGLGIGLSLVKGLVEMHGGTVEAHSDGEGTGSEFVVRLPVVTPMVAGRDSLNAQTTEVVPSAFRRILVVDDNEDAAEVLSELLQMLGNDVRTANDGEAAIEVAAQFRPDVVLMDIGMPKLNGYDAARRIREHPWAQDMVLIALTGWGQADAREKSSDAGFNHHLVKPVEMNALKQLLAGLKARRLDDGSTPPS